MFTKQDVIAWLRTKDKDEMYDPSNPCLCLAGQFLRSRFKKVSMPNGLEPISTFVYDVDNGQRVSMDFLQRYVFTGSGNSHPSTFGAALERLTAGGPQ